MVLAILLLLVTLLAVISVFRQLKLKNMFALGFSAIAALSFGFFSIMTMTCELLPSLGICGA